MCRLRLYQRQHDDIFQFDVHHAAADLWSLEIINAELERPPEDEPPPSFPEFCAWQNAWIMQPKARAMADWWFKALDHCQPLAFHDSGVSDPADYVPFRIEADVFAAAREVCRAHKITLFNLVLSVLQVAMRRWRKVDDFVLGCAAANRPNQRFEKTVGFFANPMMYRRNLRACRTWETLWEKNRATIAEVLDRQFFPLLQTMPVPRTDVLFMFQQYQKADWYDGAMPPVEPLGLRSAGVVNSPLGPREVLYVEMPTLTCPVMLETLEQKDSIEGIFRYRTTCFPRHEAEAYVQDLVALMRTAVQAPQDAISSPA
jgi:hypothetical protein